MLNTGDYLDYCVCKEDNMDKNFSEKVALHSTNYKVDQSKIHPIVFSDKLAISFESYSFLKQICKNINAVLTRVGVSIIKSNCMRADIYYNRLSDKREENIEILQDKMMDSAPRN